MKRITTIFCIALACAGLGWAAYRAAAPAPQPLSKYVPAGPLLYLEAKDFSALLSDWNSSPQKRQWIQSDNYEVFSRSRLFLRLKGASDQFTAAAGLPPDMNFLTQVSGEHSVLALYDIGNLQFLYITYLPSAKSMETTLWQTRAKFEPRSAGGVDFYLRRDPESKREVAFAIAGDCLLLATREDLMAGALQLMSGKPDRTVESEPWWTQSTAAAGPAGDLRMVLDLEKLVPNGYFRTYWVQQNITDLSQYSAAVSDLVRSDREYREERVLIRKKELEAAPPADGSSVAAEVARLVPDDAGMYVSAANPSADSCFALLETKLLAPHLGPQPASQIAPQVHLTSGEQGGGSDLETRIDQAPAARPAQQSTSALQELINKTTILASLQVQSTEHDKVGVFARIHSAVVLVAASDWNEVGVESALTNFIRPGLTASQLGVGWQQESGYQELDGLWPLAVAVRGKYLLVSDTPALMESMLSNFGRQSDYKPAQLLAAFNHQHERSNFIRFASLVDRPNAAMANGTGTERVPQFFSGNIASLSSTLSAVSAERIEVRNDGGKVRQTVTYEWLQ
ncbi:MAG TPA: hypothetical protein VKF84_03840 [Candidatus Sulfotelmatobacter sp.]|nr:hypothetical protein [Candidatus Sulfotelmatobacter sp.]